MTMTFQINSKLGEELVIMDSVQVAALSAVPDRCVTHQCYQDRASAVLVQFVHSHLAAVAAVVPAHQPLHHHLLPPKSHHLPLVLWCVFLATLAPDLPRAVHYVYLAR